MTYGLLVRAVDAAVDAERLFTVLFAGSPWAFWLDSARVVPGEARFSFLGDAGGPLAESVTYRLGEGVRVRGADASVRRVPGTVFDYLRRELAERAIDPAAVSALPFDFTCGYVGYLGYELKADCGGSLIHRADTPDAAFVFADRVVAIDHLTGRTHLLALHDGSPAVEAAAREWLTAVAASIHALPDDPPPAQRPATSTVDPAAVERLLVRDRDRYLADIEACQRALRAGESYEICLTNAVRLPAATDGYAFYRRLRRVNPAPYGAYLRLAGITVACSSPERFLRVDRSRTVSSRPIKGTAARGLTPEEDARLRGSLAGSAKTRAENLMIVDLVRNDLGRVCEPGSVTVPELMAVETYATVHQLVSTVCGRLRTGTSVVDCVRACFPGGSMTGAPKLRTMEIIDSLEGAARGVYSGAIGFLGLTGTADLNIAIRTAVLVDGEWQVGAGGAIVLDSDPAAEYDEMLLKALAPLRALDALVVGAPG